MTSAKRAATASSPCTSKTSSTSSRWTRRRNRNGYAGNLVYEGPMIINLLATWIPALLIALLGVLKLTGNPRVAEEMSKLGVGRYLRLLGVMEIAFAALFVGPATMKLGFILASCYFAGAIATWAAACCTSSCVRPGAKASARSNGYI